MSEKSGTMDDRERKTRSFINQLQPSGTAEMLRNQMKGAFALPDPSGVLGSTLNYVSGTAFDSETDSFASQLLPSRPVGVSDLDPVSPVDYERFIKENMDIIKGDPQPEMLLFPEDDIDVCSKARSFRTVQIPVPGQARRTDDPLVRDCCRSFTQDWVTIERRVGSFRGSDEQALEKRFHCCVRTAEYIKSLPHHTYEVDISHTEDHSKEDLKKLYRQSISSTVDQNLDCAESDTVLLHYLDPQEEKDVDFQNYEERSQNRHPALFGLYPLRNREESLENRTPAHPPADHQAIRVLIKISELRFDFEIEPVFAALALYDTRERRKISETFHLDCNSRDMMHLLHDYRDEYSVASMSRGGIFSITYPHSDIFLVIKIEKVLQQGDISEAADPYFRGRDIDKKSKDKAAAAAKLYCKMLGQYRMPFAWAAINVVDLIAGNQSSAASSHAAIITQDMTKDKRSDSVNRRGSNGASGTLPDKKGARTDTTKRDGRSASMSSQTSRGTLEEPSVRQEDVITLSQNFSAVTLTLNMFFKQEGDRLTDEDLYRFLGEMRRPAAAINKKFKIIPGHLKMDIQQPADQLPCCLTSNLFEIDPFPDSRTRRPTRELEEFPSREVYVPHTSYKNFLYIYPQSLDFRSVNKRNIGIKVQVMAGEEREDILPVIYGRSSGPSLLREWWCLVHYHNKQPEFYEEIKIELPAHLTDRHHILFSFYHISCQKPKPDQSLRQEPFFLGCTWVKLLNDQGDLALGEFNLFVTADHPPLAYSQLSSDVHLPNLKWIDNHRPVFKVTFRMISSIYPQDTHLLKFMKKFYELNNQLGNAAEEKTLAACAMQLEEATSEPLVKFLHLTLNNLCALLVRPTVTAESAEVPRAAFSSMAYAINRVHELKLPNDKHSRNEILCSYVQYMFTAPEPHSNSAAFDARGTFYRTRGPSSGEDDLKRSASLRHGKNVISYSPPRELDETDLPRGGVNIKKLFYEELVFSWITAHPATRSIVYANAWFFFEILIKSMVQHLHKAGKLGLSRQDRFSAKFMKDVEVLVGMISAEIAEKHIKDVNFARKLNCSLAFFIHDGLSLMDRGFTFALIKNYLKKLALAPADLNLTEFKLDFYRIICSHEHYVILNLPLGAQLYPMSAGSQSSSPSGSICSTFEDLGMPNMEAMGELSLEYRHYHYLSGLVLSELALVLEGKNSKLREQAVEVLRDLLASHDSDVRYSSQPARSRIASIYLPLLSIVMDNYSGLYRGVDGWGSLNSSGYNRNMEVRRSVIIKEGADGSMEVEDSGLLGPMSTRNLLLCILWVLKNIDPTLLRHWWNTLSISRLNLLLSVLDLCVSCFEYRGKQTLTMHTSGVAAVSAKGSQAKDQLASLILSGVGSARDRLRRRQDPQQASASLRWGKTYWQAATEQSEKPKVDVEADAQLEAVLAGEASLIVLDVIELLVQSVSYIENLQSVLGTALGILLNLLQCQQSNEVMRCIFATQRATVMKFPELVFYEETEQCGELCSRLLKHCSSSVPDIRAWACASLYLLMRQNFELGSNFARVKVQVTMALSQIVAGTSKNFDEHHLRRSLKTLIEYSEQDMDMKSSSFPQQVRDLAQNLHNILLDTVKMQTFQDDPEMLMDLMYSISKGYQNSPDLRLTWLQNMAKKHNERAHYTESAMCLTHAAALVAEYLYMLEGLPYIPIGCVAFQTVSPNTLEESAISDDVINPEEEGICTSSLFNVPGLVSLLEQSASLFRESQLYEVVEQVYKLVIPIYQHRRQYHSLESTYTKVANCYKNMALKGERRFLGSYFRVGFYGNLFGDLHLKEYIYKEEALARLGEFALKLENLYGEKLGRDKVEILKDSNEVDPSALNQKKGHIQVTYVEPYFEDWELRQRVTVFDKGFNIRRFVFNTPYTPGGKARGELQEQWVRKTILTTEKSFPYLKRRLRVVATEKIDLNPLEVNILNMEGKIRDLKKVLSQDPGDTKLLQMQLQGAISTSVNVGPFAIAKCFLENVPLTDQTVLHHRLKVCFKDFTKRCHEALIKNSALIGEEQEEYQKELERKFKDFQHQLAPMVAIQKKSSHSKKARERALMNISTVRGSRIMSQAD